MNITEIIILAIVENLTQIKRYVFILWRLYRSGFFCVVFTWYLMMSECLRFFFREMVI